MNKLAIFVCFFALLVALAMAQQDQDTVYDQDGKATHYRYSFRVKLAPAAPADGTEATLPTTMPDSCSFAKQYIAKQSAWVEYHYAIPTTDTSRPTYLFIAKDLQSKQQTCFDALNTDPVAWKQNYNSACKYRDACGGSTVCSCAEGESCNRTYDSSGKLVSSDFCDTGYLCTAPMSTPTTEGEEPTPTGPTVCTYSRIPLSLLSYNATFTEQKFYDLARHATCSYFQLSPTYNLAQSRNLYFNAISDVAVSDECLEVVAKGLEGKISLTFADDSCKTQCGAVSCVCEKGNICDSKWNDKEKGHKQCADKLKCELASDGIATCNNGVVASVFVAIIAVALTMIF